MLLYTCGAHEPFMSHSFPAAVPGQPVVAICLRCAHVLGHLNLNRLPGVPVRAARVQELDEGLLANVLPWTPGLFVRHLRSAATHSAVLRSTGRRTREETYQNFVGTFACHLDPKVRYLCASWKSLKSLNSLKNLKISEDSSPHFELFDSRISIRNFLVGRVPADEIQGNPFLLIEVPYL